ncbi:MAG: hypothetical protein KatS3mg126_1805 [Lysobacteraceae bacterium]|nr:MAG: hypothetical protein KatS3mg126_1805 [Xanthomonadaceae bacterium]
MSGQPFLAAWLDRLPVLEGGPFLAFLVGSSLGAWWVASHDFVPILDHLNLAFHEAGHLFLAWAGATLHALGGTLGQFVFPTLCAFHFARRAAWLSAAACALWWLENLRYTAFYVADARRQALPLVGGGEHDWAFLLGRWGLLEHDLRIAALLRGLCWLGWLAVTVLVVLWFRHGRQRARERAEAARRQRIIEEARQRARQGTPPSQERR